MGWLERSPPGRSVDVLPGGAVQDGAAVEMGAVPRVVGWSAAVGAQKPRTIASTRCGDVERLARPPPIER